MHGVSFLKEGRASQVDSHLAELTVKETMDFSARVQGPGTKRGAFSLILVPSLLGLRTCSSCRPPYCHITVLSSLVKFGICALCCLLQSQILQLPCRGTAGFEGLGFGPCFGQLAKGDCHSVARHITITYLQSRKCLAEALEELRAERGRQSVFGKPMQGCEWREKACTNICGCYAEALRELRAREKKLGITPDLDLDGYLKATAMHGQRSNTITLLVMRLLGLEVSVFPARIDW